jgi:hypothetical protein
MLLWLGEFLLLIDKYALWTLSFYTPPMAVSWPSALLPHGMRSGQSWLTRVTVTGLAIRDEAEVVTVVHRPRNQLLFFPYSPIPAPFPAGGEGDNWHSIL